MSIKWTLRIATLLMLIIQLVACGGGSGSEDSKKSVDVDPQDLIVLEKPVYSGNQQPANISQAAATDLVYDILFNLDFIKLMTFGETYQGFSFFYDNSIPVAGDAEVNCQSGSAAVKETVPNKQLLVSYDRCVQGKVELNGSMKLRLNGYITDVLPALDIAPELEFKELDSGEVISMSGYVQTSSASDMDEANATLYLLLTNSDGQQIHFDGFEIISNLYAEHFGLRYEGDIFYSDLGKVTVATERVKAMSEMGLVIDISGEHSLSVDIDLQDSMSIVFDNKTIPVVAPLDTLPGPITDGINESPVAMVTVQQETGERSSGFVVSALGSTDADYDVLSFDWQVLSGPDGAEVQVSQAPEMELVADLPGEYLIQLRVTDGTGSSHVSTHTVKIERAYADAEFVPERVTTTIDQAYRAQIALNNDEHDGPFHYRLVYGPEGMTVNADGQINWVAHVPDFGQTLTVNYGVEIWNEDKSKQFSASIDVQPKAGQNIETISVALADQTKRLGIGTQYQIQSGQGGDQRLVAFTGADHTHSYTPAAFEFYLNDENELASGWVNLFQTDGKAYEGALDVNQDGFVDTFYQQRAEGQWQLILEDGKSQTTEVLLTAEYSFGQLHFHDVTNDGRPELLIYDGTYDGDIYVYSLTDYSLLYSRDISSNDVIGFCDFDQDGISEVVKEDGVFKLNNSTVLYRNDDMRNVTVINTPDACYLANSKNDTWYYWHSEQMQEISVKSAGQIFVGNFDLEPGQEALFADPNSPEYYAPNWIMAKVNADHQVTLTQLTLPEGSKFASSIYSHGGADTLGVLDLDGDGVDEILVVNDVENLEGLSALAINDAQITTKYLGRQKTTLAYTTSTIAQIVSDTALTVFSPEQAYEITANGVNSLDFGYQLARSGFELIGTEVVEERVSYYTTGSNGEGFTKFDHMGNEIWTSDANFRSRTNYSDFDLGNGLLFFSSYGNSTFINSVSGDTLLSREHKSDVTFSPSHLSPLLVADQNEQKLKVYNNGQLQDLINLPAIPEESYADGEPDFIQYDDDPQLELVTYHQYTVPEGWEYAYQIFDTNSGNLEPLKPGDFGIKQQVEGNSGQLVLSCLPTSSYCLNSLYKLDNRMYLQDKLSGNTIWKSPAFSADITDVEYKVATDGSVSLAVSGRGLYILH